jgi:hypothetical protein
LERSSRFRRSERNAKRFGVLTLLCTFDGSALRVAVPASVHATDTADHEKAGRGIAAGWRGRMLRLCGRVLDGHERGEQAHEVTGNAPPPFAMLLCHNSLHFRSGGYSLALSSGAITVQVTYDFFGILWIYPAT